jgi:hypothetical protein
LGVCLLLLVLTTFWSTTGDFFIASFQCPHHVERLGALGDGGKWVCGVERLAKQKKCVVYSFGLFLLYMLSDEWADGRRIIVLILVVRHVCSGINGESSFEATLLERAPGCEVWGYDFTVKSVGSFKTFQAVHRHLT